MNWFTQNWVEIVAVVGLVITVAGRIAQLTPTDVDNKIVDKIASFLAVIGLTKRDA